MDPAVKTQILSLLDRHRTMSLATVRPDGWPQATTVGFAHDGLTLYLLRGPNSQKTAARANGTPCPLLCPIRTRSASSASPRT